MLVKLCIQFHREYENDIKSQRFLVNRDLLNSTGLALFLKGSCVCFLGFFLCFILFCFFSEEYSNNINI